MPQPLFKRHENSINFRIMHQVGYLSTLILNDFMKFMKLEEKIIPLSHSFLSLHPKNFL
jgi:hypothetical protein